MALLRKILKITGKVIVSIILFVLLVTVAGSISYVYDYPESHPFRGTDIYDPYKDFDTVAGWKRINFHTHTKVKGLLNECDKWPDEVYDAYKRLGYDGVAFSNHNELTRHPVDTALQINVYEHGYNIFKYHKLVFGSEGVNRFDHLLPLFTFQKQYQLDMLGKEADFLQLNHPPRTRGLPKSQLQKLEGYKIMELDCGKTTDNEYWDWALSEGRYSFGLANDDLHFPDRTHKIAIRCNFINTPTLRYEDVKEALLKGRGYAMRVPDYGDGDWDIKYASNKNLPYIKDIGLSKGNTIFIELSSKADSIKITGQNHRLLTMGTDTAAWSYPMKGDDPYARITAYFPGGEVIYTNPFARYDSKAAPTPFAEPTHTVNILLTVLFNLALLVLCVGIIYIWYLIIKL